MIAAKKIPIKSAGAGCIAVKEDYLVTHIADSLDSKVTATFCVDRFYKPCRACVFKGNYLTPIGQIPNFDVRSIISGKKGIYSRLDCVAFVVMLRGVFREYPNGNKDWVNVNIELYTPMNVVSNESLSVMNFKSCVPPEVVNSVKNSVIANLGSTITSKISFLKSRV